MFLSEHFTLKKSHTPVTPEPPKDEVNLKDFDSVADAIEAVPANGTIVLTPGESLKENFEVTKPLTINGNGAEIEAAIAVSDAEVTIKNAKIIATGKSNKSTTPAISVTGSKPFTLIDCEVSGTTRTGIKIATSGEVNISGNTIDAGNKSIYNAIEFSIGNNPDVTEAIVENNVFEGTLGNNGISLYNVADGANVAIRNNTFNNISVDNNSIRLSNPKNNNAVFDVSNNTFTYSSEEPNAEGYTAFMLLQDYSKTDVKQDFSKFKINFTNLKRGDKKLTEKGEGLDTVYIVYSDKENAILADGVNDPEVTFK